MGLFSRKIPKWAEINPNKTAIVDRNDTPKISYLKKLASDAILEPKKLLYPESFYGLQANTLDIFRLFSILYAKEAIL